MVCICLCLSLLPLGLIFLWTLFWDCLELRRGGIAFSWLLIDSPKWLILYHVIRLMMLAVLLNCSFERLFDCMVFRILSLIVMLSFSVIFGDHFGINWELNCCLAQLVTLRLMDKLRWLIELCQPCLGLF